MASQKKNLNRIMENQDKKIVSYNIPYFIEYIAHTSRVRTWISQWFLAKNLFLFFKNNFTGINHCKFIHHKSHLKPFLSYLPCIVWTEYFSIIFKAKKCALYSIKYTKQVRDWILERVRPSQWVAYAFGEF
jgi:hypothetical protein